MVRETVFVNDAFRLRPDPPRSLFGQMRAADIFRQPASQATQEFAIWLQEQIDAGVLSVTRGPGRSIISNSRWQESYIQAAYVRGLDNAGFFVMQAGRTTPIPAGGSAGLLAQDVHGGAVDLLWFRSFNELTQNTERLVGNMVRTVATGLNAGVTPARLSRDLRTNITASRKQAEAMMQTEIIRAHSEAQLNLYRQAGATGVAVQAELMTAGDDRVCVECLDLEAMGAIPIEEARGLVPVHVRCRCGWIPVFP